MVVLALPGRHDRMAVRSWLEGVSSAVDHVFNTLPTLSVGDAWIWTPQEKRLSQEHFPLIATYDTSSTPAAGYARAPRAAISEDQLAELQAAFGAILGVGDMPKHLRTRRLHPTVAGRAIVRLTERPRVTQDELARQVGSGQKSISRAETGTTHVSTELLERIAERTGFELRVEFVAKAK